MTQFQSIVETLQDEGSLGTNAIQGALAAIRQHLGMEVAYLSEFVGDRTIFRQVDAPGLEHIIAPGDSRALDEVYCNHILEGRLPELIADTSLEPLAMSMAITSAVPIGSHASIPIRLPDGSIYGMFCCLSPRANTSLNERDLQTMRVFAGLATQQIHAEHDRNRSSREKRAAVSEIISTSGFDMVFQPIFSLVSMQAVAFEALCRFQSAPYRTPDRWFADAAEIGLGVDLELGAIAAAIRRFPDLPDGTAMSINASPDAVISGRLAEALDPRFLDRTIIEITEHAQVSDYDLLHDKLAGLRQGGAKVAIDDAGAGYSGLQHIVQMSPDIIKMDISLTRGIDQDRARRALASAMIFYARETGSTIVAEGIETAEELQTLKILGASRGQGYLLGRPAALDRQAGAPRVDRMVA